MKALIGEIVLVPASVLIALALDLPFWRHIALCSGIAMFVAGGTLVLG